ncbi:MAG: hypothetical protein JEY91_08250 [Spirochaetaceae bacterium]|nr:hypothetical protein [Spirochaetaceae bacterium]
MKCDKCNRNEADISIGYLKGNHNKTLCLCEECSERMGLPSFIQDNEHEFTDDRDQQVPADNQHLQCPECSTGLDYFLSTGRTGCSHCYQVFKREINRTFRSKSDIFHLSRELKSALSEENYEYAATLRDRFDILSGGEVNEFIEN